MRKYLYMIGIASLVLINASVVRASNDVYYTNRENINMTEREYNNLLELGFTEDQIEGMNYQTFIDNKDIEAELLSRTTQYVRTTVTIRNGIKFSTTEIIPEEKFISDMNKQVQSPPASPRTSGIYYDGISEDDIKGLTTTISSVDDYTMRYKLDIDWYEMPSTRSWDIIGIGIEPTKVEIGSFLTAHQNWRTTGGVYGSSDSGYTVKSQSTGGSVMIELPSGSIDILQSYLYFNVNKVQNVGTIQSLLAVGDYAHATTSVDEDSVYNYYTVNHVAGVVVQSPYHNDYVSVPTSDAVFVGTW